MFGHLYVYSVHEYSPSIAIVFCSLLRQLCVSALSIDISFDILKVYSPIDEQLIVLVADRVRLFIRSLAGDARPLDVFCTSSHLHLSTCLSQFSPILTLDCFHPCFFEISLNTIYQNEVINKSQFSCNKIIKYIFIYNSANWHNQNTINLPVLDNTGIIFLTCFTSRK